MPSEPVGDAVEPLDAAVGAARATQVVALLGKAHHLDLAFADAPQLDEELLSLLDRTAQVLFAVDQQQRRAHLRRITNRRAFAVERLALIDRPTQDVVTEPRPDVGRAIKRREV